VEELPVSTASARQTRIWLWLLGCIAPLLVLTVGIIVRRPLTRFLLGESSDTADSNVAGLTVISWAVFIALAFMGAALLKVILLRLERVTTEVTLTRQQLNDASEQLATSENQLAYYASRTSRRLALSEHNLRSDRFSRAVLQATGNSPSVRTVGLLALEELANEHEAQFAASTYEFLASVIKEKSRPDESSRKALDHLGATSYRKPAEAKRVALQRVPSLASDVETAIAILARNRALFDRNVPALADDTAAYGGTGLHLLNADLSGVWLRGVQLHGATLTNVRLNGAVLSEADLSDATITSCRMNGLLLHDVDLSRAQLTGVVLAGATFNRVFFDRCTMRHVSFEGAYMEDISLNRSNITSAVFADITANDLRFEQALLAEVDFRQSTLDHNRSTESTFAKSTLSGVDFGQSRLNRTRFENAAMADVRFRLAQLQHVTFQSAALRDVQFDGATLAGVKFEAAELAGVSFESSSIVNPPVAAYSKEAAELTNSEPEKADNNTKTPGPSTTKARKKGLFLGTVAINPEPSGSDGNSSGNGNGHSNGSGNGNGHSNGSGNGHSNGKEDRGDHSSFTGDTTTGEAESGNGSDSSRASVSDTIDLVTGLGGHSNEGDPPREYERTIELPVQPAP